MLTPPSCSCSSWIDGRMRDVAAWVTGPERSPQHSAAGPQYESMEYNPANSAAYRDWLQWQPHGRVWDKWLVMALIGISVGTTSFLLQKSIQFLFSTRELLGRFFIDRQAIWGYLLAWMSYVLLSAVAALGAALLVVKVAPAASASGVPHIMAYLNGVRIPKVLNVWTFVVKFWSCSLAVAAGLPVGPEGPLIHMGAILGAAMSGLHSTTMGFDLGVFRHLRGSKNKRDFVTAGVAAGVAAAFDAPLGGLLFAFEEVASFWHSHLGWQVFFCCTMAVLVQVRPNAASKCLAGRLVDEHSLGVAWYHRVRELPCLIGSGRAVMPVRPF
jgi:chloride channel 7